MDDQKIKMEQTFLALLQKALQQGRKNGGRISREEIREIFEAFSLDEEQTGQVENYLQAHKIAVGNGQGGEEALLEEEKGYLDSYRQMLEEIPKVSDSVLEALKISAMAGEASARRELSEQMLPAVVDIARLYAGQGVSIEDLIGAGNEALVRGVSLLGYLDSPDEVDGALAKRVMDSMEDLISLTMDQSVTDREMEDLVNLVADQAKELSETLGRKVTARELAGEGEVTMEQITEALRLTGGQIESLEG